ncbi:hypothetical protein BDA99DRAFT_348939 [Phascolomyces articulosus]|uniref:Uncharacterized protein n=1 Tax=Phascolomyces articulosus TaxID=60185 RepID=A0AAD5K556_9FUNG|nr:hypothetical protein BDA99DRAFT_348939 [Phascolomyces articulosus]
MTNMTFGDPISAGNNQLAFQNTGMMNNPYQQQQQQQLSNPYQQQQQLGANGFVGGLQAQMTGLPQQSQMTGAPFQTSTVTGFQQPQFTAASNNPFGQLSAPQTSQATSAFGSGTFGQTLSASPTITASTLANRSPSLSVANTAITSTAGQSRSFSFPSSPSMQPTGTQTTSSPSSDGRFAKLNALLANKDDGMDTFGNTGNLRFPTGSGFANSIQPDFTGATNINSNGGSSGDLLNTGNNNNGIQQDSSNTQSSFADSFNQQTSRNPFGQPSPSLAAATPKTNNQKSLLELMQEQKQQQQQQLQIPQQQMGMQPQMTGMQPQMTGMQPQMTGMQPQMTATSSHWF